MYAKVLGEEMAKYDAMLFDKYVFFYYNTLANNYSYTNTSKAFVVLDEFEHMNRKSKNSYYDQFIHLNRALLYFDTKKYNEAIRSIIKLYVNDHYKQTDKSFKLKIETSEAIMQYESGDIDTTSRRVKQIKKSYKDLLRNSMFTNDKAILEILQLLALNESKKLTPKLEQRIKSVIKDLIAADQEAIYAINYLGWLAPKVGTDISKLTAGK